MIPFLGELKDEKHVLFRALPLREAVEALAASLGEKIEPFAYSVSLQTPTASAATTFAVSADFRINTRLGTHVIIEGTLAPFNEDIYQVGIIPDADQQQQQDLVLISASQSIGPIVARKSVHIDIVDPTEAAGMDPAMRLHIAGFRGSERFARAVERIIGVAWSKSARVNTLSSTKILFPWSMRVLGIRSDMLDEDTGALDITVAGRYLFPNGWPDTSGTFGQMLFGPSANQRFPGLSGTFLNEQIGLAQTPFDVQADDELEIGPTTATSTAGATIPAAFTVFGRIRR